MPNAQAKTNVPSAQAKTNVPNAQAKTNLQTQQQQLNTRPQLQAERHSVVKTASCGGFPAQRAQDGRRYEMHVSSAN